MSTDGCSGRRSRTKARPLRNQANQLPCRTTPHRARVQEQGQIGGVINRRAEAGCQMISVCLTSGPAIPRPYTENPIVAKQRPLRQQAIADLREKLNRPPSRRRGKELPEADAAIVARLTTLPDDDEPILPLDNKPTLGNLLVDLKNREQEVDRL